MDLFWCLVLMSKKEHNTSNFLFILDDEWKVNFLGSFNSIMKTKTKFRINQIINNYMYIVQRKKNTRDKLKSLMSFAL